MVELASRSRAEPVASPSEDRALALCRTPFQAAMLREVLKAERVRRYDVVYLTHHDSEEDRWYHARLAAGAQRSQYLHVPRQRWSVMNQVVAARRVAPDIAAARHALVLLASFDSLVFRGLVARRPDAALVSFDDGAANIDVRLQRLLRPPGLRPWLYDLAFGVPSARRVALRSARHYTAYPGFENIMPRAMLRPVAPFDLGAPAPREGGRVRFFIGQPFREYADEGFLSRLVTYARRLDFDWYVRHPREAAPLLPDVPALRKEGRLAEDAIVATCAGRRPVICGGFSTVLLNIGPEVADKTMILRARHPRDAYLAELGARAGCEVVLL